MNSRILSLVARRLVVMLTTLLIVSFIVFSATSLLPGDTATILLGQAATPEAVAGLRTAMHLDDPALLRFIRWLFGLVQGDLGTSYANNMAIADLIGPRFINSMKLAGITTIIAVPLALTLGISSAMLRGTLYDRAVTVLTIGVISVPEFMIATLAENAVMHGLGPMPAGGTVTIDVRETDDKLAIRVADDGRGLVDKTWGGGIGLANIRARLRSTFGDRARLLLEQRDPRGVEAVIELPLRSLQRADGSGRP